MAWSSALAELVECRHLSASKLAREMPSFNPFRNKFLNHACLLLFRERLNARCSSPLFPNFFFIPFIPFIPVIKITIP